MSRIALFLLGFVVLFTSCKDEQKSTEKNEQELLIEITGSKEFKDLMNTFIIDNHGGSGIDGETRENEKSMLVAYGDILLQYKDELASSKDELSYNDKFKRLILASDYDDATKQYMIKRVEETAKSLQQRDELMLGLIKKYPELNDRIFRDKAFNYYRNSKKL